MDLRLYRVNIPFTTTFKHGSAVRSATQSVCVEAQAADVIGVGEGCPREYVTGEGLASAQAFFERYRSQLCHHVASVDDLTAWVADHRQIIDASPAAWCAVELALLDLLARQSDVSVEELAAAPAATGVFRYSAVVGDSEPDAFRAMVARYRQMGFDDFKLKLSGDLARDREKLETLQTLPDRTRLRVRVDANNLWDDPDTAAGHLTALDFPFVGIEEPLPANALDDMRIVSQRTNSPIILDESFLRAEQLASIADDPERWIVNIRVSKMGGLLRSLEVVEAARHVGIPVIVGAQVGETSVLTRAALSVARAAGSVLLAQEGAFGTHLLEADVATRPLMFSRAGLLDADSYALSTSPGWGFPIRLDCDFVTLLSQELPRRANDNRERP